MNNSCKFFKKSTEITSDSTFISLKKAAILLTQSKHNEAAQRHQIRYQQAVSALTAMIEGHPLVVINTYYGNHAVPPFRSYLSPDSIIIQKSPDYKLFQ